MAILRFRSVLVPFLAFLVGCQEPPPKTDADAGTWQPSVLSEAVQEKIRLATLEYQRCVNDETRLHLADRGDSRRVTDQILGRCEPALAELKSVMRTAGVPEVNANLYLRGKRSRAAQQVLRIVMATQAQRAASQEP